MQALCLQQQPCQFWEQIPRPIPEIRQEVKLTRGTCVCTLLIGLPYLEFGVAHALSTVRAVNIFGVV